MAIGDGCWGNTYETNDADSSLDNILSCSVGTCQFGLAAAGISAQFYYGHAMYNKTLHDAIVATCGNFTVESDACNQNLNTMNQAIGQFDIYK